MRWLFLNKKNWENERLLYLRSHEIIILKIKVHKCKNWKRVCKQSLLKILIINFLFIKFHMWEYLSSERIFFSSILTFTINLSTLSKDRLFTYNLNIRHLCNPCSNHTIAPTQEYGRVRRFPLVDAARTGPSVRDRSRGSDVVPCP